MGSVRRHKNVYISSLSAIVCSARERVCYNAA